MTPGPSRPTVRVVVACSTAYAIANAASWLQPFLMAEIIARLHLGEAAAGLVLTAEMLALALSSILYARLFGGARFLVLGCAGVLVAVAGNILSLVVTSYSLLLAARLVCGLGEGMLLMVALTGLARFDDADRLYGRMNVFTILSGLALAFVAPRMAPIAHGQATFATLLGCLLLLLPVFAVMPPGERLHPPPPGARAGGRMRDRGSIVLVATSLPLAIANAAIWSFCYVIGGGIGLAPAMLDIAMTLAIPFALFGGAIAGLIGDRFGRSLPATVAIASLTIAGMVLTHAHTPRPFQAAMGLYLFSIYLFVPYLYGLAAARDPSGRSATLVGSAYLLSFAIGPYAGGVMIERVGAGTMGWIAALANGVTLLFFVILARRAGGHAADRWGDTASGPGYAASTRA